MQSIQAVPDAYSVLSDDPDLAPLVAVFVDRLPKLVESLYCRASAADWKAVRREAHQLKGSSKCYGYDTIAMLAAQVEDLCENNRTEFEILSAVDELRDVCQRVRVIAPN